MKGSHDEQGTRISGLCIANRSEIVTKHSAAATGVVKNNANARRHY